jgi:hypothetical protein
MRRFLPVTGPFLALASLFGGPGLGASASAEGKGAEGTWEANDDDALLFDVKLNQYRLGDGVRGYQTPTGVCIDLSDAIMALDIPVRLDKKLRRATGWAFEERHTISIDRDAQTVQIINTQSKLSATDIRDTPEGWCVDATKLTKWLGVPLVFDTTNALILVKADHKLPVELALERRARAARVAPTASFDLKSLPQSRIPFRGVKPPSVDVVLAAGGLRAQGGGQRLDVRYEFYASGEIGPVAYDARLASNAKARPETLRVRAYRTDPEGKLFGPLRATQVAVGDVLGFSTPLVAQSSVGRGAMLTNRPLDRPDTFSKTNFRGELPAGWDAELYRNGQLIGIAVDRADGRYEFLDIPLLFGQNRFEVVLYGPQGQIKREEQNVGVGPDSIPPKSAYYWAGINQDGRDLLSIGRLARTGTGGWRGSVGYERGLDQRTSVMIGFHSLELQEVGRRNFAEASIRRSFGSALFEFSGAADSRGGTGVRGQLVGQFGQTYVSAESATGFNGFISDRLTRSVRSFNSLSVDRSLKLGRTTIPAHIEANYTKKANGVSTLGLETRLSASFGRYNVTGELGWEQERLPFGPDPPGLLQGRILANARIGKVRLRGESRFYLAPQARFESASLIGEWSGKGGNDRFATWRAELGYDQSRHRLRGGLGYVRRFDKVAVTAQVEGASDGSVAAGINLSFSLGPDPRKGGGYRISSSRLASQGQVMARVFRDLNSDGRRQVDEPWEKDVQLAAGRVPVRGLTNADGEVMIDDLSPFNPVLIGVDADSLPDPLIQPSGPGVVVTPRPGVPAVIELALTSAGEVDGTLVSSGGVGLEGVDLELIEAGGRIVSRTRSDFDGFFLFEKVPYGHYAMRIAALSAQAAGLGVALKAAIALDSDAPTAHLETLVAEPDDRRSASAESGSPIP